MKAVTAHNTAEMVHNIILLLSPIMPIIPKCTSFENKPFKDRYTPKIQKLNAKTTTKIKVALIKSSLKVIFLY